MKFRLTNDEVFTLLKNRVDYWIKNKILRKLFYKMYEAAIETEMFNCGEWSINEIVDNDYMDLYFIDNENKDYKEVKELYKKEGLSDISCYKFKSGNSYDFIEAEYKGYFLVR